MDDLNDTILKIVTELRDKQLEIIELFCKTFAIAHKAFTPEELRELFMRYELECSLGESALHQIFRIQLREPLRSILESIPLDEVSKHDKGVET